MWPRILNLSVYTSYAGRSIFIFKVKGQFSWSMDLYKEFWHLDPCGQDIARTIQSRLLKHSMYTSYGKEEKAYFFKVKGKT